MQNFLDPSERKRLEIQHKYERDGRTRDRIKAVLLYDKGWSYRMIAEALFITPEAARQHTLDYERASKLSPENGGSSSKLNKAQTRLLLEHLQERTYLYAKDIAAFVWDQFEVRYTISGMTQWLQNHGFSYKKPAVVPGKVDKEAQQAWIDFYEGLKRNLGDDETICFMDGVHPTHNAKPAYGWIQKGKRKELPTNTGRQRVNLSGMIDIISKQVLVREDETLEAESTIRFLRSIEEAYPHKRTVHLFCDNARYYRNKKVHAFLENSKISMHFLPPYSPNLNPIERLWKLTNELVINNKYYEKFSEFKNSLIGFLKSLSDPPQNILKILRSRITDNFRAIGSPVPVNSST
jgi:transposase